MAIVAGLREKILIMDEPIFGFDAFCDTMLSMEKFSIPQVSGTHMVSMDVFDKISEHSKTSFIESNEPRLQAMAIKFLIHLNILVFLSLVALFDTLQIIFILV